MQYKVIIEDASQGVMGGGAMESATSTLSEKVNEAIQEGLGTHWGNCTQ